MVAKAYDFRRQLTGRELVHNPPPAGTGPNRLWQKVGEVPFQKSIIVYNDGTVLEGISFTLEDINDPDVHTFIYGGTDFRCEASGWLHDTLVAAGYGCQFAGDDGVPPAESSPPATEYPTD